jgi:hypothetical protein
MIVATSNPALSTQLAQAIPFALAATVYPPAIAVLIYYLGAKSPKRLVLAYYFGAFAMTLVVGIVGISLLGDASINPKEHPNPSAGLDMVLGVLMLAAALLLARRKPRPKDETVPKRRSGGPGGAAALGVVMYLPSLFYLSAMKEVADANPGGVAIVLSALVLTLCVLLFIEIPIILFLLFPTRTDARLKQFDGWLHREGRKLLIWGFTIGGLFLVGQGISRIVIS